MIANALSIVATIIVLSHCLCFAAHVDAKAWRGDRTRLAVIAVSVALLASGTVGTALQWQPATTMLVLGIAGRIAFDRRRPFRQTSWRPPSGRKDVQA